MFKRLFMSETERAIADISVQKAKAKAAEAKANLRLQDAKKAVETRNTKLSNLITKAGEILTSEVDVIQVWQQVSNMNKQFQAEVKKASDLDEAIEKSELNLIEEVNKFRDEIKPLAKKLSKGGVLTPEEEALLEAYLRKIS